MPEHPPKTSAEADLSVSAASLHQGPQALHTAAVTASPRLSYLPQLDGLRAVAILMVFAHHLFAIPLLWSGVDLFFILSGFLITNILLRDSARMSFGQLLRHFYLRRAQRILPAYGLAVLLIALFTREDWRHLWPYYAFFLQNVPYAFHQIGFSPLIPLWSLAVEQHFYLVWPFLVYFLPRRWLPFTMAAVLVGAPLARAACTPLFHYPEPIYVLTPFRIDTMDAGALAALLLPRCNPLRTARWAQLAIPFGLLAYALLAVHPWFRRNSNTAVFNSLAYSLNIVILGGLFLWSVLAQPHGWLNRLLSSASLRGLGRISYAFYLLHMLVILRFGYQFPHGLAALGSFSLTAVLATLSWYLLEKPILSLGGRQPPAGIRPASAN